MATLVSFFALTLCGLALLTVGPPGVPGWMPRVNHPVVLFPGYSTSRLKVTLEQQTFSNNCPSSAVFEVVSGGLLPRGVTELCAWESLRLLYNDSEPEVRKRFSSLPGVRVEVSDFGALHCAPVYVPLYIRLMAGGYKGGESLFVACYDYRMAPNVDVTPGHSFLEDTKLLVEKAYEKNNRKKVYLLAHSNGSPMALSLLQSQSTEWADKYIAGFVSYAGNWAGQGSFLQYLFTGFSSFDFSSPRPASAFVFESWPSVYFSLAQPRFYGNREVLLRVGNKSYTSEDYEEIYREANLTLAMKLHPLFNGFVSPQNVPSVSTFSFYGTGILTKVGVVLPKLERGVLPIEYIFSEGDGDQEDIDNTSNLGWKTSIECRHFEAIELPQVRHILVPFSLKSMRMTLEILRRQRPSICEEKELPRKIGKSLEYSVEHSENRLSKQSKVVESS